MRIIRLIGVIALLGLSGCATCKIVESQALGVTQIGIIKDQSIPGEIVVKARDSGASAAAITTGIPGATIRSQLGGGLFVLAIPIDSSAGPVPNAAALDRALSSLRGRPDIEYAHPNYVVRAFDVVPNDACWKEGRLWAFKNQGGGTDESLGGVNLPRAWSRGTGQDMVTVAVLDTGLVANHYDFSSSNIVRGYNFVDNNDNVIDKGSYHGSHVAGTIGALASNDSDGSTSINWNVRIQPVRVLNDYGSGSLAGIVAGIRWAGGLPVPGAPVNPTPAKVLNMSLGGYFLCSDVPSIRDTINEVHSRGTIVVVAAGNARNDASLYTPAGCPNVVTVAASGPHGELSFYSNYGSVVKILAPGGNDPSFSDNTKTILSSVQGGFGYSQGTSMAAPHVAGVMALTISRYPTLSNTQIIQKVLDGVTRLRPGQCDMPCGKGLLNADIP